MSQDVSLQQGGITLVYYSRYSESDSDMFSAYDDTFSSCNIKKLSSSIPNYKQ